MVCCIQFLSHLSKTTMILLFIISFVCLGCNAQFINLEELKDAVLSAEGTIGDIFRSLDFVAKHLKYSKDVLQDTVEEECKYSCPDGSPPKKNKNYRPTSNGCGVLGLEIDISQMSVKDMTRCCDEHDICYGTCNKDKDNCDLDFKKCVYKICDNPKMKASETILTGCKTAAKTLYSGTTLFGCKFYKSAQAKACYCPSNRKFSGDEL